MNCKICGRAVESENSNFCNYCGGGLKENNESVCGTEPIVEVNVAKIMKEDKPKEIGVLNWLFSMLIVFIPLVGPIVYFVMLIVWSFGGTEGAKKNWARASLIFVSILIILYIGLIYLFFSSGIITGDGGVNMDALENILGIMIHR